jgi:hypothetical protein
MDVLLRAYCLPTKYSVRRALPIKETFLSGHWHAGRQSVRIIMEICSTFWFLTWSITSPIKCYQLIINNMDCYNKMYQPTELCGIENIVLCASQFLRSSLWTITMKEVKLCTSYNFFLFLQLHTSQKLSDTNFHHQRFMVLSLVSCESHQSYTYTSTT